MKNSRQLILPALVEEKRVQIVNPAPKNQAYMSFIC